MSRTDREDPSIKGLLIAILVVALSFTAICAYGVNVAVNMPPPASAQQMAALESALRQKVDDEVKVLKERSDQDHARAESDHLAVISNAKTQAQRNADVDKVLHLILVQLKLETK